MPFGRAGAPRHGSAAARRQDHAEPLDPSFYDRPTERVARDLLGCVIETVVDGRRCSARIVETEAYLGEHDGACHAAAGRTARTEVLYGPPGIAYVYLIYGMHWCANAVTRRAGLPSAVLIRAAEPIDGLTVMRARRGAGVRDHDLTSGPGRLCAAMGITGPLHHGVPLWHAGFRILRGSAVERSAIAATPRIGITAAAGLRLRFVLPDSPYVSAMAQTARFLARSARNARRTR